MSYHNLVVEPPRFSKRHISPNADVNYLASLMHMFDEIKSFGGEEHEDVIEFLESMNGAQEVVQLSKGEFLLQLHCKCKGLANKLLREISKTSKDITFIYSYFLKSFKAKKQIEKAAINLAKFGEKSHQFTSLIDADFQIRKLARRASMEFKQCEQHKMWCDYLAS